jgi:hypothetical protein
MEMDPSDILDSILDSEGSSKGKASLVLVDGEELLGRTPARASSDFTAGVLILTNRRLLHAKKGAVTAEVSLPAIESVEVSKSRLVGDKLEVTTADDARHKWERVDNPEDFASLIERARSSAGQPSTAATGGGSSLVDELERLAALKASGDLTDEEYAAIKKRMVAE